MRLERAVLVVRPRITLWARLGLCLLAGLALLLILLPQPARVSAAGEGVFSLSAAEYFVTEGAAVDVTIVRTGGTTLAQDVEVTLELQGGVVNQDYPASTITQLATFPKGTNLSEVTVRFQTLNQARLFNLACGDNYPTAGTDCDNTIQIFIRSVSFGVIGDIGSARLGIIGSGAPVITSISPHSGTTDTVISLTGLNFSGQTAGGLPLSVSKISFVPVLGGTTINKDAGIGDFNVVSPTLIQVPVRVDGGGSLSFGVTYRLQVTTTDGLVTGASLMTATHEFVNVDTTVPTVTGLSVHSGPTVGGTAVRLFGTNLACGAVTVGGVPVSSCTASGLVLDVVTPPGLVGPTFIRVANGFGTSPQTVDNAFTYVGAPKITALSPAFGPDSGGTTVTITGSGFTTPPGLVNAVTFGGTPAASFVVVSDTKITAVAPPMIGGGLAQVRVTHSLTGQSAFTTAANYTYVAGPLVSSLSPALGPPTGGTVVTISGTGFAAGATVTFGGVPATFVIVDSQTRIRAASPAGKGIVQVTVTVNGTSSPSSPESAFQYTGPTVTLLTPNAGPTKGTNEIVIQGTNFTEGATVMFGDIPVTSTFVSPIMLKVKAPAFPAGGEVDVVVVTPSGESIPDAKSLYTYTDGPIVASLNPATGPATGGTIIVITGKNFTAEATVLFGEKQAAAFNFNSDTQVTVLSPPVADGGVVNIRVTTSKGKSPVNPESEFTYVAGPPEVAAVTPNKGRTFGGETVVISGKGFLGAVCPGAVTFGINTAPSCTVHSDTTITAITPPNVSGKTVVLVKTPKGSSAIVENFTYESIAGGGGDSGTGGGGTAPPANGGADQDSPVLVPATGQPVSYTLFPGWSSIVWRGKDDQDIGEALANPGGVDLTGVVREIYTQNPATGGWLSFRTANLGVPGANDFTLLRKDRVYWVVVIGDSAVTWLATDE